MHSVEKDRKSYRREVEELGRYKQRLQFRIYLIADILYGVYGLGLQATVLSHLEISRKKESPADKGHPTIL